MNEGETRDKPTRKTQRLMKVEAVVCADNVSVAEGLCCMNQPAEPASPNPIKGQATFTAIGAAI